MKSLVFSIHSHERMTTPPAPPSPDTWEEMPEGTIIQEGDYIDHRDKGEFSNSVPAENSIGKPVTDGLTCFRRPSPQPPVAPPPSPESQENPLDKHSTEPFFDGDGYRGVQCSCGFCSSTGSITTDWMNVLEHWKDVLGMNPAPSTEPPAGEQGDKDQASEEHDSNIITLRRRPCPFCEKEIATLRALCGEAGEALDRLRPILWDLTIVSTSRVMFFINLAGHLRAASSPATPPPPPAREDGLKCCPFCGGPAKLHRWPVPVVGSESFSVECDVEYPHKCPSGKHYLCSTVEEAITAWNTRVPPVVAQGEDGDKADAPATDDSQTL